MDGFHGSLNSPPPFLTKTYEMVDDPATNLIVSWGPSNNSFIVWNLTEFCRDLLPKYFKHNNFSSFVRQLNTYGFKKVDPDQWEFSNEEFIRGQRHLLKNIHRRKPIHSHSQHPQSGNLTETEKQGLEEEIEKLKQDKSKLIAELQRRAQEQHDVDMGMQTLEDRLRGMEHRQKQMKAFLAHIIQKPVLITDLINQSELQTKRQRLPKPDYLYDESDKEDDDAPMTWQLTEETDSQPVQAINMEPFKKMELSINYWENFLGDVSHASGEEMCPGTLELEPSTVWQDVNLQLPDTSPIIGPYLAKDLNSSPEVAESTSDIETSIPYMGKESVLDINAKPSGTEVPSSDERVNMGSNMQTGANDLFWEQFLTETPGSTGAQEVQSERRDTEVKNIETKVDDHSSFWLKKKSVDHITEQMGNLNPVEKATDVDEVFL